MKKRDVSSTSELILEDRLPTRKEIEKQIIRETHLRSVVHIF